MFILSFPSTRSHGQADAAGRVASRLPGISTSGAAIAAVRPVMAADRTVNRLEQRIGIK